MENSNDVFMFCLGLSFYLCFHSKLVLSDILRTLVHTTMLEKTLSNKIDNIMLFVRMPSPI